MGSRPLRYTFTSANNEFDLRAFNLEDFMLPTTTGWSVSVESVFIEGIQDTQSLGNGLALNFRMVRNISTPENIARGMTDSFVIGTAPLNSITTAVPPNGNSSVGYVIWQNPNTWGTRTKWVFNLESFADYVMSLRYANLVDPAVVSPDAYSWLQFTLAFYDERTGSDEVI